jgi:hypothetical protein
MLRLSYELLVSLTLIVAILAITFALLSTGMLGPSHDRPQ